MSAPVLALALRDLVFPRVCPVCSARPPDPDAADPRDLLCALCRSSLLPLFPPWCVTCGASVDTALDTCHECIRHPRRWRHGYSVYPYRGDARFLVQRYKYGGHIILGELFARDAVRVLRERGLSDAFDCIVPVPMHWFRYLRRGYNQTELVARSIASALGIPVVEALRRVRYTRAQAALSRAQRLRNLAGAFAPQPRLDLAGRRVLLLDDVLTTGATLAGCHRALKPLKPASVDVLTIARG